MILFDRFSLHAFRMARHNIPDCSRRINDGVDDAAAGYNVQLFLVQFSRFALNVLHGHSLLLGENHCPRRVTAGMHKSNTAAVTSVTGTTDL